MQPFDIPVKGLKTGENNFSWHIGKEFFESFENAEILAADLSVEVVVRNEDYEISAEGEVEGTVTVQCDRCLGELVIPVQTSFEDDEFEGLDTLPIGQDIYDYVMISLPIQRVHEDGECDEEQLKYLNVEEE